MKKLFITGGSGFVGGHLAVRASSGWDVYAAYRSYPVPFRSVKPVPLQLEDRKSVSDIIRTLKPDAVIHCAAWSDPEHCEQNREKAYRINTEGTVALAETCAELRTRLIFTSSDMVFDGLRGDYGESDITLPINVYGKTKLAAEQEIQSICSNYVIARSALVYGKPLARGNSFSEKIAARLRNKEIIPLYTDQFRTPIWVQNLAESLLELTHHDFTGIIHLGGPEKTDRYSFGLKLAEIGHYARKYCKPVNMSEFSTAAPRPKDTSFDISLARRILKTSLIDCHQGLVSDYSDESE